MNKVLFSSLVKDTKEVFFSVQEVCPLGWVKIDELKDSKERNNCFFFSLRDKEK